jgi:hypothetical protein
MPLTALMAAQQTVLTEWSAWAPTPRANKEMKKESNMVCNGIQQRSIVVMIGSDANNRFRDIVSSKVLDEWDECQYPRRIVVENHHGGSFKCQQFQMLS